MKVRNIAQISILMGFLASTQSNCMLVTFAKTLLQKTGTAVGVGLPTAPFVAAAADGVKRVQNPTGEYPGCQPLPADQEAFYRKTVGDNVELKYMPGDVGNASCVGNLIVMPEKLQTTTGEVSLAEALKKNNDEALKIAAGTAQHEHGHSLHNDSYKTCAEIAVVPIATTALAAFLFKRTFPASNTLPSQVVRFGTKALAGEGMIKVNQEALNLYAAYASRQKEFAADKNIRVENRAAVMDSFDIMDNIAFTTLAKQKYPHLNKSEQKKMAAKLQQEHYSSPYATHPSTEARKKALGVYTGSQQAISGQHNNKL